MSAERLTSNCSSVTAHLPCHGHTLSSASAEAMSVFSIGSVAVSWSVLRALQIIGVLGVSCVETLMLGRGLASRAVTLQF